MGASSDARRPAEGRPQNADSSRSTNRQALQLPNEALKEGKDLPASRAGGAPPSEAAPVRNPSVEQSTGLDAKFGLGEVVHSS